MALIRPIPTKESIKTVLPMTCTSVFYSIGLSTSFTTAFPPITDTMTFQIPSNSGVNASITQNNVSLGNISQGSSDAITVNITDFEHPISIVIGSSSTNKNGTMTATYNA